MGVGMGRRPLLAMAAAWLAVVVVVGAITFVVVERDGRGVGQASAAATVALLPSATATPGPTRTTPADSGRGTASFTSDGGTVVATCRDGEVSLDSIRPRDGWRFEKESEHGGLEVVFRTAGHKVDLLLSCVRGVPSRSQSE